MVVAVFESGFRLLSLLAYDVDLLDVYERRRLSSIDVAAETEVDALFQTVSRNRLC